MDVRRALVRSRDRLDYATARHDDGDPRIALLGEIGERLIAAEAARGGVSLPLPEQEVVHANGGWALKLRGDLATEAWNAQISLLTGRAAARLMLDGGSGCCARCRPRPPRRWRGCGWRPARSASPGRLGPPTATSSAPSTRRCPGTRRSCTTRRG